MPVLCVIIEAQFEMRRWQRIAVSRSFISWAPPIPLMSACALLVVLYSLLSVQTDSARFNLSHVVS